MSDPTAEEVQASLQALTPPKRKRKGAPETDLDPEIAQVEGVVLLRDAQGWRAVRVRIPAHTLEGIALSSGQPDMLALAMGDAERMLTEIAEQRYDARAQGVRPDGVLTPAKAREDLAALLERLADAYWAGAHDEPLRSLRRFAETGRLEPESIGRKPCGEDRAQLQALSAIAGWS